MVCAHIRGVHCSDRRRRSFLPPRRPAGVRRSAAASFANRDGDCAMLTRMGEIVVRWPKIVLSVVLVMLGAGIVFGGKVSQELGVGGFTAPATESSQADTFLD